MTSTQQRAIHDIYRLTPMQEGMLFHTLSSPGVPLYLQQHVIEVTGVDGEDLHAAVSSLIERHDVLRTGFVWEGVDRPVQVVFASAPVPLTFADPISESSDQALDQALDQAALDAAVEAALDEQRTARFDIRRPPLLAMCAVPAGPGNFRIAVTHHHLILDGWSVPILHAELASLLRARRGGVPAPLEPPGRFREFVRAIGRPDADPYWSERFGDLVTPTPLGADRIGRISTPDHHSATGRVIRLGVTEHVGDVAATARRHGLLPSTIVHAAWGLLLSRYADQPDATFGITLSGRAADLTAGHDRVGMFINSLPLRMSYADDQPVRDWLDDLQAELARVREREHASLAEIARVSGVAPGRGLYESVFAFQNYWRDGMETHTESGITVRLIASRERTSVPIAVAVALPAEGVWIRLDYDTGRLDEPVAEAMAEAYLDLVGALLDACENAPSTHLGDVSWRERPCSGDRDPATDADPSIPALLAREIGLPEGTRVLVCPGVEPAVTRWLRDGGLDVVDTVDPQPAVVVGAARQIAVLPWAPQVRVFVGEGPVRVPSDGVNLRLFVHEERASLTRLEAPVDGGRIGNAWWLEIRDRAGRPVGHGAAGRLFARTGHGAEPTDTGLRAQLRADGDIDVLGPGDHTDWVARHVATHPQVGDAAVVEYEPGRPVAWIVPAGEHAGDPAQITAHLSRVVPPELLPVEVEMVDRLPVDGDGRLNRDALAAPEPNLDVPPPTPLRARLDAIDPQRRRALLDVLRQRPARGPRRRRAVDRAVMSAQQEQWAIAARLCEAVEASVPVPAGLSAAAIEHATTETAARHGLATMPTVIVSDDSQPTVTVRLDATTADVPSARELATRILATAGGWVGDDTAEPALRYSDYAAWQTDSRYGPNRAAQLAVWQARLAGLGPLRLGTDRVSPAVTGIAEHALRIDDPAPDQARWVAATIAATARLARADDVAIGVVLRPQLPPSVADMLGPFSRMLPVRVAVDADATMTSIRDEVAEALALAAANGDVSWSDLRGLLPEELPISVAVHGAQPARAAHAGTGLAADVSAGTLLIRYDRSRWHPTTVASLARLIAVAAGADAAGAAGRVADLDAVDDEMRAAMLGWGTADVAPIPDLVPELVRAAAKRRPNAIAVDGPDGTLTYAELVSRAQLLAGWLRARGLGAEDRVAVYVPRSTSMVWAALGVLMAGAAYVPVDAAWPAERLSQVLADVRAGAVVTDRAHQDRFEGLPTWCVDETVDRAPAPAPTHLAPGPANAAYIIYTSGSTGTPKGVLVEHRALANFVRQIACAYGIDENTRLLGFASLTFDISVFDIWTALTAGATLVLAGDAERRSADDLQRLLQDKRVSAAELPPSLLPLLSANDLPELRLVSVGGEAPAAGLVDVWADGRQMWNGYGPTETTVAVTLARCEPPSGGRIPPIGRPMINHRAYVLDDRLRLVPPGVPGELCIAGAGVARGYLGQPGQTAARFVPDPYTSEPGARMYRTGDLVRWAGDGQLEFLGRVDRQVKLRGFRIELGEVESVLSADPRIRQVVVEPRDERLVAYVVPGSELDVDAVREIAGARLPDYMVPTGVAFLASMPLNPHGKVDRKALALVPLADLRRTPAAPEAETAQLTDLERTIVSDILAPLLGAGDLTPSDDFFRLGGNSLQAMQVTARVRDRFGVDISLADFFVTPTGQRLADLVESALAQRGRERDELFEQNPLPAAAPDAAADPDRPAALGFPQERLWRMNELEPGHPSHHAPLALRLTGALDLAALRAAVNLIVARHAPLRARFTAYEQTFAPAEPVPIGIVDTDEVTARRLVREEAERPFDLGTGPMLRVHLYRLGADDHVLQWNVHHIVTDGWSIGVMLGELFAAYNAAATGNAASLPPLPAHYRDFVEWQRGFVSSPEYQRELAWWREYLGGVRPDLGLTPASGPAPASDPMPATELTPALDPTTPARRDFRHGWRNVRLDEVTAQAVTELSRRNGVTLFMVTLGAWSLALAADHAWDELAVVVPLAGRHRTEWEPLVGYFVNRVVVRVPLDGQLRFTELMTRLRQETARTFAHQDVPFEELIRELAVPTEAISVNFSIQNAPQSSAGLSGLRITPFFDVTGQEFTPIMELYSPVGTRFEASLMLRPRGDAIAGGLEYNAAHFTADRAELWARRFETILARAAADPDVGLSALARMAREL